MAGQGPAPKPADERARRNKTPVAMRLPAAGRHGRAPKHPLPAMRLPSDERGTRSRALRKREMGIWTEVWKTPQAVAWEQLGWTHNVALYVRLMALGEAGDLKALTEARQWADRLGLSPLAMLRLQWVIDKDEVGEKRNERSTSSAPKGARERYQGLRAVSGGSSAGAKG